MIDINCKEIKKTYDADTILDSINFTINEFEKVALIGLNGSGKTTLFKILTDQIDYDSGEFYINQNKSIGYLQQSDTVDPGKSVYETVEEIFHPVISIENNLRRLEKEMSSAHKNPTFLDSLMLEYGQLNDTYEAMNGYRYKSLIRGVLNGLSFPEEMFHMPFDKLSGGQKNRLMLARLLLSDPEILLLDEPTNHLDIASTEWLERFLQDFKGTMLIISHDRYFLDKVVSRTFYLSQRTITSYAGNYSYFIEKWNHETLIKQKKYLIQEKEINRQKEIIARFLANGRDKKVRQAKSREKMLQQMALVENPETSQDLLNMRFFPSIQSGTDVLVVSDLSKSYGDTCVFNDLSFSIYRGDKIGLIGPNGIGKTTLLRIIQSIEIANEGDVTFGHHVKVSYFDQELSDLNFENSVLDEIWDAYPKLKAHEVRNYLARFLFYHADLFKSVGDLSGGEKSRLSFLKLMLSNANFLLLDEPTNHLDIDSKLVLEKAIESYEGTVLIISHDRYFLNKTTNKIFEMSSTGITEYLGNYDYYAYKKSIPNQSENTEIKPTKTELKNMAKKERASIRKKQSQRRALQDLESSIYDLEEEIHSLEIRLCEPETYNDHILSSQISDRIHFIKSKLNSYYIEWDALYQNKEE
jgi:ATP-binding cassette subfamily F protein 3